MSKYDRRQIERLREEGHSLREIARRLGCSESTVSTAMADAIHPRVREAMRVHELLLARPYEDKEFP